MRNINRFEGDNTGGLECFYFAAVEDIVRIPAPVGQTISQTIEMLPGATWYAFYATAGTLQYTEKETTDRIGTRYALQLKGFLPKDTPELQQALAELTGRRLVLIYKDHNRHFKLVGTQQHYLVIDTDFDTAAGPSGRNGVAFTFRGESTQKALFYTGSFTVADQGDQGQPPAPTGLVTIQKGNGEIIARVLPGSTVVIESGFSWGFRILS